MGPIYNVLVTRHHGRNGIEVLIDSLASDGSKSWVVIRRGVGLCVTELPTECTRSMHADICAGVNAAQSAERPAIDMAQHAQSQARPLADLGMPNVCRLLYGSGTVFLAWMKWCRSFLRFGSGRSLSYFIHFQCELKTNAFIGIHRCKTPRDFVNSLPAGPSTTEEHCLMNGTDRIRSEYCLGRNNRMKYMRSMQGHSRGVLIQPKLQNNVENTLRMD